MKKYLFHTASFLIVWSAWQNIAMAQAELVLPAAILTSDVQSVGLRVPDFKYFQQELSHDVGITAYLNGILQEQTASSTKMTEAGNLTIITSRKYHDTGQMYYRAPPQMPTKNPVEIKIVYTTTSGKILTLTKNIYVVAEHWKFYHVHGLKYACPENIPVNPMATLGSSCIMEQSFHFEAGSFNPKTGEATAVIDGEPAFTKTKIFSAKPCDPNDYEIAVNWGDIFTKIKEVKVKFTGSSMAVEYKIDYMDFAGWNARPLVDNRWIQVTPHQKGNKNAIAQFETPLQKLSTRQYKDPNSTLSLRVVGGISLKAL